MPDKKRKADKSSSSGHSRRAVKGLTGPAADPTRGRREQAGVDPNLDERATARKNAKPRSAREALKGPNDRKASPSQKGGRRARGA